MSLFDNMMNQNPKNQKQSSKKTGKASDLNKSLFKEEFGEDYSVKKASEGESYDLYTQPLKQSKRAEKSSFKQEFSDDLFDENSRYGTQSYSKAGVSFEKISDTQAKVTYNGLLVKSGANEVFGVLGFGSNQSWENVSTTNFNKFGNDFEALISVEQGKNVNLAFKDSAGNWDNNSGMNYTFVN